MTDTRTIERWVGAVLAPEVRVAGTIASATEVLPSRAYLERFPPAIVTAFGRTPAGAGALAELLARLRGTCAELGVPPPAAAVDLEQGAGLHFRGATRLPPALALASAACGDTDERDELDWIWAAGELTAREARAAGAELVLAPVADVNTERDNPIIATRSFGDRPSEAAARAVALLEGLRAGGAGACAKHFPGHGDTSQDSHVELPAVRGDARRLRERELVPFERLVAHGSDCVMIAHLDVPALTGEAGLPSTLSRAVIEEVLRGELGFRGTVVSDAMNMGALERFSPRYVRALAAGCDVLLCPHDPLAAAEELLAAAGTPALPLERLRQAAERALALRESLRSRPTSPVSAADAARLAERLAERALRTSREHWPLGPNPRVGGVRLLESIPAAETPEFTALLASLRGELASLAGDLDVQPVFCEARAGRGRYGLSADERERLRALTAEAARGGRPLALLWFGSPQSLDRAVWEAGEVPVLLALAPTPPLVAAAGSFIAALLARGGAAGPKARRLPAALG
jgi:beta-glucosidase-like glycosyl hydrolase